MALLRRFYPAVLIVLVVLVIFTITSLNDGRPTRTWPGISTALESPANNGHPGDVLSASLPTFHPGVPKPPGSNYSRAMVIASTKAENTSWIGSELPELPAIIYVADDPHAALHPPRNKGHEVMVYLTYLIDHYDRLPDVVLFMHAHRWTYHNNELQGADAVNLVRSLSDERVMREGYMNLRCHWHEGCPGHLHPLSTEPDFHQLQRVVAKQWPALFPLRPVPASLSQPCCAQFALSRDRIRAIPRADFVAYRDWLLRTPLTDYYSGRVWEYLWQVVFTGNNVLCPEEHVCYCDGYGICFGGSEPYAEWFALQRRRRALEAELLEWRGKDAAIKFRLTAGKPEDAAAIEAPEFGRDVFLQDQIDVLGEELEERKRAAKERGLSPQHRAEEAGRTWIPGDGF